MKRILTAFTLLALFFLLLLFPEPVKTGAQEGLYLWYNSVVPILFPFMILSNAMVSTDSLSIFLRPFFLLARLLPGLNPWLFYPLFFGFFCGFPMGAKTIADLMDKGLISQKEASFLLPIVNQASPMFLAGYVGVDIMKKQLSFPKILFYVYLPPVALFLLYLLFSSFSSTNKNSLKYKNSMSRNPEHTIWNAFTAIVTIGIYMMLFTIALQLCLKLLPENQTLSVLLCTLEFSSGLHQLCNFAFLTPVVKTGLILALTSFGGFCTAAQTSGMIKDTGLSMKSYLLRKILIAAAVFVLYSSSASS